MRRGFFLLLLLLGSVGAFYSFLTSGNPAALDLLKQPSFAFVRKLPKPNELYPSLMKSFSRLTEKGILPKLGSAQKSKRADPEKMVTLYLRNGNAISGKLVSESKAGYVVNWEGGDVSFSANEVERVERKKILKGGIQLKSPEEEAWPYRHDVVIKLTNGEIVDAEIGATSRELITTQMALEGGGLIEQDIERAKVEALLFRPVETPESKRIEENLRSQFKDMKFYREGSFTIVTDSYATWVQEYRKILRQHMSDVYLRFLPLFKGRKPLTQNFVVIFDSYWDFVEYATIDGVPGWLVLGYFKPTDKVLYLFNALGDQFSEFVKEAMVGRVGKAIDQTADQIKQAAGSRYDVFVDSQAQDIKNKFESVHNVIRNQLRSLTESTLRHESTHEIFHNWGLQGIVVSKMKKDEKRVSEIKKKFLEDKDPRKRRQLFQEMFALRRRGEAIEMDAANSWFVEGTATFSETAPPGETSESWLYLYQDMVAKNRLYPIEQLTVYKMGSFPGVYPEAMLYAYAESWAFVRFLMDRYPAGFMRYLERMVREKPKEHEDLEWLLSALGKDLKDLEQEFTDYMAHFESVEDPDIKMMNTMRDVFESF